LRGGHRQDAVLHRRDVEGCTFLGKHGQMDLVQTPDQEARADREFPGSRRNGRVWFRHPVLLPNPAPNSRCHARTAGRLTAARHGRGATTPRPSSGDALPSGPQTSPRLSHDIGHRQLTDSVGSRVTSPRNNRCETIPGAAVQAPPADRNPRTSGETQSATR
jgi:hypothetical protein